MAGASIATVSVLFLPDACRVNCSFLRQGVWTQRTCFDPLEITYAALPRSDVRLAIAAALDGYARALCADSEADTF